jgi:hypothetical protein
MGGCPSVDGRAEPDTPDSQVCFGLREVFIGLDQLVDSLTRDAEHLGNLCHAHQVDRHTKKLRKPLVYLQEIRYYCR